MKDHPLLKNVRHRQDTDDKRPFGDFVREQVEIAEKIGGSFSSKEARKMIDEKVRANRVQPIRD